MPRYLYGWLSGILRAVEGKGVAGKNYHIQEKLGKCEIIFDIEYKLL